MGKTFEEWYAEVSDVVYQDLHSTTKVDTCGWIELDEFEIKNQLQKAWEAGRMNMTYKDI